MFKACCDMTRYYLSHLFHVHVLSKGTNLMQAIFFLYLYAHFITYLVHLQSVQKFALTKFTSFYCVHLKWCIPISVLLIIQIYALYFLIPWSLYVNSFNKKWYSLFHRGWFTCFITFYRLILTQKNIKALDLQIPVISSSNLVKSWFDIWTSLKRC